MQPHQLTIGFPTYMRRDAIVARLQALLADPLAGGLRVLVIDNGSTDGTYEEIQTQCVSSQLTLLRNASNIGIVRNLTRLFRECQTDYLLLMSDEDELVTSQIAALLTFLDDTRPLFVSPQAITDGKVYRGIEETRAIAPGEFHSSSFYISGLVYHRESTCRFIDKLESLEPVNTAARLYPLGVLATELMLAGNACWLGLPLSANKQQLPSLITDKGGDDYWRLPSRWRQYVDFLKYFDERERAGGDSQVIEKIALMRGSLNTGLYARILSSIQMEAPDSEADFRRGAWLEEQSKVTRVMELEAKLENFRGMIQRRDDKIAKLEAQLARKM